MNRVHRYSPVQPAVSVPPIAPAQAVQPGYQHTSKSNGNPQFAAPIQIAAKSKTTAIILTILLSEFIWLYTYERDKKKFWIAFPFGFAVCFVFLATQNVGLGLLDYAISLGFWVWADVDTARKPSTFYIYCPNNQATMTVPGVPPSMSPAQPVQ